MTTQIILLMSIAGIASFCAVRLTQIWKLLSSVIHVPETKTRRVKNENAAPTVKRKRLPRKPKVAPEPVAENSNGVVKVPGLFGESVAVSATTNG